MNKIIKQAHLEMEKGNTRVATSLYKKALRVKSVSRADKTIASYMLAYLQFFSGSTALSVLGPDLREPITNIYDRAAGYFAEIDSPDFSPKRLGLPEFAVYELTCIALSHHLAALNIVKNQNLVQKLAGWHLYEIGCSHLLAALVILNDKQLLAKLTNDELDSLRNYHFRHLYLQEKETTPIAAPSWLASGYSNRQQPALAAC